MGFSLLFQGSKGDLGMTGPSGAAGLPVSVAGRTGSFSPPIPTPNRAIVTIENPEPEADIQS